VVIFKINFKLYTLSAWFYGGADFERQILPAHRSVPVLTTSRSAHAPLTCSGTLWEWDCKQFAIHNILLKVNN